MCGIKEKEKYADKQNQTVIEKLDRLNAYLSNDNNEELDGKTHHILVIEDDLNELEKIRNVFNSSKIKFEMMSINNGQDAISFLEREGQWNNMPVPDLIIMDVNLPHISGTQILKYLKKNSYLSWIPKLVVTEDEEKFKELLKKEDANTKIVHKPFKLPEFKVALSGLSPLLFNNLV